MTEERIDLSLIIPAYNEKDRLPVHFRSLVSAFESFAFSTEIIIVDDCSRPEDKAVYESLASEGHETPTRILRFERNQGKGAAIRAAFAIAKGEWVGFVDADGATPVQEVLRLANIALHSPLSAGRRSGDEILDGIFGSRIKLLGREITRSPLRHATGRIFATLVARVLDIPVYDSQCGCKFFRRETFAPIMEQSTEKGWLFDVEVIARAYRKNLKMVEIPISWNDISGSKVSLLSDGISMALGIFRLASRLGR